MLEPERSLLLAEKPIIGAQLEIVKASCFAGVAER